jgi:hypothetical protein
LLLKHNKNFVRLLCDGSPFVHVWLAGSSCDSQGTAGLLYYDDNTMQELKGLVLMCPSVLLEDHLIGLGSILNISVSLEHVTKRKLPTA